jgi:uncharacterized protein (DUF486 family)
MPSAGVSADGIGGFIFLHRTLMPPFISTLAKTVGLLIVSNTFMTIAWYGHLKFEKTAMWKVILASWLIASLEYCFQVPANRIGNLGGMSLGQLKILQEMLTLIVFVIFVRIVYNEKLTWNYYAAFACILGAVFFVFYFRKNPA